MSATGRAFADRITAVAEPIADALTSFTIGGLAAVAAEPVDPMPSAEFGAALTDLDAPFAREFIDAFLRGADSGLMRCAIRILGGAIADELGADRAAVGAMQADALMSSGVLLFDPTIDVDAAFAPLRELVAKHPGGNPLPTFLSSGATLADAYDRDVLDRLGAVKRRVDPGGVIRSNRPLR